MKNIGLYFGTFNPIHIGHLIIANHMAEYSNLDEVWLVVTPHNPMKKKSSLLADHHRFQMVEMALENYSKLKASKIEFNLPQPNYTINTLIHLEEKYPKQKFSLIMGKDNLQSFKKWKNYEVILERYDIYVYPRIYNNQKDAELINHKQVHLVDAPIVELSSTFIRKGIETNKNIQPLLPHEIWQYIDQMNFYKKN